MSPLNTIDRPYSLRRWQGPLTEDLVRRPGQFGLGQLPSRLQPDATVKSVCGFCATGCSLNVHLHQGEAINLSASPQYPVNLGMACPKGWEALTPLAAPDRATVPLLRGAGGMQPIEWHQALATFRDRFKAIQAQHGKASVAFLSTGQIPCEEMAMLGCFAKFQMGVLHGDGNTRQCMATAVAAYKQSFGFDAPPYTYADYEESDVIVFVGANPCIAHPIMWQRVMRNRRSPEIVVVDPRKTETAMAATRHLAIQPKSDLALFYGLANLLIEWGAVDRAFVDAHTEGFDEFAAFVRDYDLPAAAARSGLTEAQILSFAELLASGKRVSFWWTMGVNQSYEGTRIAQSLINLALMTGNIGKPGTGANSITGQCNAMGSRLFSNTTNLLGGHDFKNPAHRTKVAAALGIDPDRIPTENSLAYDQILEAVEAGQIKGLWIIATNPAHSWIEQGRFRRLREQLDFLVVQDMYHSTETAQMADLLLPAAGWGEKDGVFINSERRIGRIRKTRRAPGQALSDFYIFKALSDTWDNSRLFERWQSPADVFQTLKEVSRGQPCDITGIRDYDHLDEQGGIQWPCPEGIAPEKERRLFADGRFFTPSGRARFHFDPPAAVPEPTDGEYPFWLLTGRGSSAQWHTQTRSAKSDVLRKLGPKELCLEICPDDAHRLGIEPQQRVRVRSRRGETLATAVIVPTVQPGQVFLPMHFPGTNFLTHQIVDPHSRQPSYKGCAVTIELV
ncbi:MAG: molybdopterin-dependent oxidoreductase [Verrucomicrobiota bacterium JB022]|nr:molybdopterin-dependent oxidoreductase [Verrucomicrobiota bacterium JB022]